MAAPQTLLESLRTRTVVDCDTMDVEVVKKFGPFADCTSNQAIAFFELSKPEHKEKILKSIELSKTLNQKFPGITATELAVEIAMVSLQLEISQHITGYVHVQTNPQDSYDTQKTYDGARRIVHIFQALEPSFDVKRVCIKIPSTWEGLQACRSLQAIGITTLATTLFTMEQVAAAAEASCHYIAPYVNELKVHFEPGFTDHAKAQLLCLQAQQYYTQHAYRTQVLPASLTSIDEIMQLAGVHHITISPPLLAELASTPVAGYAVKSLFDGEEKEATIGPRLEFINDEVRFRREFGGSGGGEGGRKLSEAINIFNDMQSRLEALIESLATATATATNK